MAAGDNPGSMTCEVAIVGGGVAGASLAIALARAGRSVVLIEREPVFRDRVRGDSLFPWGALEAARLGIDHLLPQSGARPLPVWQSWDGSEPNPPYRWQDDVPSGDVLWGVNHPGLQEALFAEAANAGAVTLRPAKATALGEAVHGQHRVIVTGGSGPMEVLARLVVGADGRESGVRKWIGAETIRDPLHHVIGGCLVADIDLDPDAAHRANFPGGMSLIFRHASGNARAYLVCDPSRAESIRGSNAQSAFIALCAEAFPDGAFARAKAAGPAAFFPGIDIFASTIAGDRIVLIGDAAGANDPSQGQGLSLTFRDVRELGSLLAEDDWDWAIAEFARRRASWYEPLRSYATWVGPLVTDVGPAADRARQRAAAAAAADPSLCGYADIHALGPEGLPVSIEARRHVLGEDLPLDEPEPREAGLRPNHQ